MNNFQYNLLYVLYIVHEGALLLSFIVQFRHHFSPRLDSATFDASSAPPHSARQLLSPNF